MIENHVKKAILRTAIIYSITLLSNPGAGFSPLESLIIGRPAILAAQEKNAGSSKKEKTGKARSKKVSEESQEKQSDELFLEEPDKNIDYLPEIFRCPECGYEQDEDGFCPDHNLIALVKTVSPGRDPLAPVEYDGNEDIIVDIPLKNIQFVKDAEPATATASPALKQEK